MDHGFAAWASSLRFRLCIKLCNKEFSKTAPASPVRETEFADCNHRYAAMTVRLMCLLVIIALWEDLLGLFLQSKVLMDEGDGHAAFAHST